MIGKMLTNIYAPWMHGAFRKFVSALIEGRVWRVILALTLVLSRSITQGAQLLLLVPLMQLVGLDVQQGSVGWLTDFVSSIFGAVGMRPTLVTVLVAFVVFSTMLALVTRWQTTFNQELQEDFVASLRRRLYESIAHSDWLTFSRSRASDFAHALTTELDRVNAATAHLLQLITNIVMVTVYVLLALRLSVAMTALVFFCGAGLLLVLRTKTQAARWTGEDISFATNGMYSATMEHLGGMKTTKSYGVEERNVDIFSELTGRVKQMYLNGTRNYAETAFWFSVGSTVILSIILYVSFEILSLPAAGLLLLLFFFNRMMPLFSSIQQSYQQCLNALPAFSGVTKMTAHCEEATEAIFTLSEKEVELRRDIRLDGVSFAYRVETQVSAIRDLDTTIEAGKTTAIVGPSGAGKSTIADLVIGLIVPNQGSVLVDDTALDYERMRSWRRQIGYVAQDTFLFNDTVRANLLWACPDAGEEEIEQALKLAAAGFVYDLPEGMRTMLGDRGVRLSGGERQRLALARALLRKPSLLILDEATSALDSENERRIQDAIEHLHGHMTILIITHRLSTIRGADIIHVLEQGRLVESGNWNALFAKRDGRFGALAEAQGIDQRTIRTRRAQNG